MALPVVMAAIAGGAALAKGISGAVQASKARKALENFQRQELKNITEGMRVSTLGAELQTQEAQRRFATSVDALRSAGVRGVVGGLGQQEQLQQRQQQQISADLDRQQQQIEMMRAQDEARIRGMQEERETFDIGRLAGQQAAGRAQLSSAIGDVAGLATSFISPAGVATPKDNTTLLSQPGTVRGDISAGADAIKGEYNRIEALRRNAESFSKLGTGRGADADLMSLKALAKNRGLMEIDKPSFFKRIF
jgi:hypothetical protein